MITGADGTARRGHGMLQATAACAAVECRAGATVAMLAFAYIATCTGM
jgi:hypothetical protein